MKTTKIFPFLRPFVSYAKNQRRKLFEYLWSYKYSKLGAMSIGEESYHSDDHIKKGLECQHISNTYSEMVKAVTLNSLLGENNIDNVDLLSLDV